MKRTITSILTIFLLSTLFANAASPTMIGRRGCGYAMEITPAKSSPDSLRSERYAQERDHGSYDGGSICTVSEFLDICSESGVVPLLHLKKLNKDTHDCAFLTPLVRLVEEKKLADRCILLTSEPDYIDYLMLKHPEIKLQYQADAKWEERFEWSCGKGLDVQIRADLVDADCVKR